MSLFPNGEWKIYMKFKMSIFNVKAIRLCQDFDGKDHFLLKEIIMDIPLLKHLNVSLKKKKKKKAISSTRGKK